MGLEPGPLDLKSDVLSTELILLNFEGAKNSALWIKCKFCPWFCKRSFQNQFSQRSISEIFQKWSQSNWNNLYWCQKVNFCLHIFVWVMIVLPVVLYGSRRFSSVIRVVLLIINAVHLGRKCDKKVSEVEQDRKEFRF